MKKIALVIVALVFVSCNKQEVLLPQIDRTIVEKVDDLSQVYIFFKTDGNDTIADLNRSNTISSTNYIFNIDKRLSLKLVVPQVQLVQKKKEISMHKSETSDNYFSYSDSIKKSLAFLSFTKIKYVIGKPKLGIKIYFSKNQIFINDDLVEKGKVQQFINELPSDKPNKYFLCFDKNMTYGNYIKSKVFVDSIKFPVPKMNLQSEEFIY